MNVFKITTFAKNTLSFINCFNECWIPDDEQLNYSGKLSQNKHIVIPIKKIGLLTRFKKDNLTNEIVHDVLILLSGIEPQRSILEIKLLNEFKNSNLKICLVRGINDEIISENNIRVYKKINSIQFDIVQCKSHQSPIYTVWYVLFAMEIERVRPFRFGFGEGGSKIDARSACSSRVR